MKFFLLLAVLVATSFAAPQLPTTFSTDTDVTIIITGKTSNTVKGKGTLAEDNENEKKLDCLTRDSGGNTGCELTVYEDKMLYVFSKDSSGTVLNCTAHPLSANASKYRNEWVWVPESKDKGPNQKFDPCPTSGELWELELESKIDLKVIVNGDLPVATDNTIRNSTGSFERVRCFSSFKTNIEDPSIFTPPPNCKQALTEATKEDIFLFHGWF